MKITLPPHFHALQPPLHGYYWQDAEQIVIPVVASQDPRKLLGFLAEQEAKGKWVRLPTVINARLARLLEHRGYRHNPKMAWDEHFNEWVDGYEKPPADP